MALEYFKSWRILKLLNGFNSYGDLAELVGFGLLLELHGEGSVTKGATRLVYSVFPQKNFYIRSKEVI